MAIWAMNTNIDNIIASSVCKPTSELRVFIVLEFLCDGNI